MRKSLKLPLLLLALCSRPGHADADAAALLARADAYRLTSESARVETQVLLLKDGLVHKERRYSVLLREDRRSLVLMQSPAEQGQKVLLLGDDYWLIIPKTQRPIRITATQKLLGEASTGDIATLRWSGDYAGTTRGQEPCGNGDPRDCVHLSLQAQRKGLTYSRIELWLVVGSAEPVRADLFLKSDKLAKRARFSIDARGERPSVSEMQLIDELQAGQQTVVRYLSRAAVRAPDEWFNPMFLTRAELRP